jgi:signal transduction histidine kinase
MPDINAEPPVSSIADEAMRIAGLNLRSLFDQFPFAVQIYLPDGRAIYRNPAQIEMWGSRDDAIHTPVVFESATLSALGLMPYIRRGFGGETVALPVTRYAGAELSPLNDREPIWVQTLIYPINDEAGTLRAVVVMHIDVTERQESQQLLEERVEERTRETSTLLKVSQTISSTLDLTSLLDVILEQLKVVADYSGSTVILVEDNHFQVVDDRTGVAPGEPNPEVIGAQWPLTQGGKLWETLGACRAVIIEDVLGEGELARAFRERTRGIRDTTSVRSVRSWLAVPLVAGDRAIGFIGISKDTPGFYTEHHARLAMAIAAQAATAIENARLFEHERRTAEELATLLEISRTVSSTLELEPLLGLILDQIKLVLDYTSALILTVDGEDVRAREYRGPLPREVVLSRPTATTMSPEADARLYRGEPVMISDVWDDSDEARLYRSQMGEEYLRTVASYLQCLLVAPLVHKGNLIGALVLTHETPGYYTERHATLAQTMANQVTSAVENARLFEQARRLAALEERQRLARELHDSVSQVLFSIGLGARTVRTLLERGDLPRVESSTEYIVNLAEMGMAEMRALLFELRPESLEQEGLVAAIAKQVEALRARHGIEVETDLRDEPLVSLEAKEALYRIAQEAMHNTVKHAGASRIEIRLGRCPDGLVLEVRDNGRGFDPTGSFPGHLGLRSMRERVTRVGGALDLQSAPQQGTTIRVQVPVPA